MTYDEYKDKCASYEEYAQKSFKPTITDKQIKEIEEEWGRDTRKWVQVPWSISLYHSVQVFGVDIRFGDFFLLEKQNTLDFIIGKVILR
jgi:hypothetical protein